MLSLVLALMLGTALPEDAAPGCGFEPPAPGLIARTGEEPGLYCFSYTYPEAAARIEALRSLLETESRRAETQLRTEAAEMHREAAEFSDHRPPPHALERGWSVAADAGPLLSLLGATSIYSGGAHGNLLYDVLIWDRNSGGRIRFADLFDQPGEALRLLARDFCPALAHEQKLRRGDYYDPDDMFAECPSVGSVPLLPVAGPSGRVERIQALLAPYVAGPYAEGPYEIDLPVGPALLGLVKPRYRPAFAGTGTDQPQ